MTREPIGFAEVEAAQTQPLRVPRSLLLRSAACTLQGEVGGFEGPDTGVRSGFPVTLPSVGCLLSQANHCNLAQLCTKLAVLALLCSTLSLV